MTATLAPPPPVSLRDDEATVVSPSLATRAVGAGLELVVYLCLALVIAVTEYFVAGPFRDFGPSNFWIAFVVMAAWEGWQWPAAHTVAGSMSGQHIALLDGTPAAPAVIAVRQLCRFGVLYGLPILVLPFNAAVLAVVWATVGAVIWRAPGRRSPWDLLAGTIVVEGFAGGEGDETAPVTSVDDLRLDPVRARDDGRARRLMFVAGLSSVLVSGLIIWSIFSEAAEFVGADEFSWGLLFERGWFPRRGEFDLSTLFVGTLWVTGIAIVVAGPVGLGVAFYLSEYASPGVRRYLKPLIETLASIPSVVLGLFAISFVYPNVLSPVLDEIGIFSLLAAGIGVGVLTVPIVASISEDAMRAVPRELREASYGLGGRKVTTALRVVFPAAISGISAAFIVAISRAIGETMVVYIAAGGTGGAIFNADPLEEGQTLTAAMASLGAGTDSVAGVGIAFQSLYFLGALLFVVTMVLNLLSDVIVRRFRQAY